jgi:hypothetical protein
MIRVIKIVDSLDPFNKHVINGLTRILILFFSTLKCKLKQSCYLFLSLIVERVKTKLKKKSHKRQNKYFSFIELELKQKRQRLQKIS